MRHLAIGVAAILLTGCKLLEQPAPDLHVGDEAYGGRVIAVSKMIGDVVSTPSAIAWISGDDDLYAADHDGRGTRQVVSFRSTPRQRVRLAPRRGGVAVDTGDPSRRDTRVLTVSLIHLDGGAAIPVAHSAGDRFAGHPTSDTVCYGRRSTKRSRDDWFEETRCVREPPEGARGAIADFGVTEQRPRCNIRALAHDGRDLYVGDCESRLERYVGFAGPPLVMPLAKDETVSSIVTAPGRVIFATSRGSVRTVDVAAWPAARELCAIPVEEAKRSRFIVKAMAVSNDRVFVTANDNSLGGAEGIVFSCRAGERPTVIHRGREAFNGVALTPSSVVYGVNQGTAGFLVARAL
ncbi:MAG: hypothetical protein KF819_37820 [Labilithrix sp.]|nr:hypothetical protein [Labilithrix sp.]